MSVKKLIILAVVLVAVGIFYYVDKSRVERIEKEEEEAKNLFAFAAEDVSRVRIEREGEVIAAERAGEDAWKIVEPYEAAGDKASFRTLVSGLANGKIQRRVEDVEDLANYGLTEPVIKVSLFVGGATGEHTILFGNQIPSGADYFAMREGEDTVLTLYSYLYNNANKSLFDFLDKSLVDFEVDDVHSYEVLGKDVTLAVEVPKKNRAQMLKPDALKASYSKVNSLLWKVKNAKVARFGPRDVPDSELGTYGLVDPATEVVLGFGEQGSDRSYKTLHIGNATERGATAPTKPCTSVTPRKRKEKPVTGHGGRVTTISSSSRKAPSRMSSPTRTPFAPRNLSRSGSGTRIPWNSSAAMKLSFSPRTRMGTGR
jgi:hypothetical protein